MTAESCPDPGSWTQRPPHPEVHWAPGRAPGRGGGGRGGPGAAAPAASSQFGRRVRRATTLWVEVVVKYQGPARRRRLRSQAGEPEPCLRCHQVPPTMLSSHSHLAGCCWDLSCDESQRGDCFLKPCLCKHLVGKKRNHRN